MKPVAIYIQRQTVHPSPSGTHWTLIYTSILCFNLSIAFKSCQDNSKPFGYESSDLKNIYLSKQALNARLKAPIITQEQLLLARASQCSAGNPNSAGPMKSCSQNKFD